MPYLWAGNEFERERATFPSSLQLVMQTEQLIRNIKEKVNSLLVNHPSHFLVEVRIKPTNNIKIFIDADEDVILSDLIDYNRKLYKQLEESGWFTDGNFSLEVSSPGLDEPLKLFRQYKKNTGRFVDIQLNDGEKKEGKLMEVTEDGVIIETITGKNKKKEIRQESILFDQIKNTKIQIKF